MSCCRRLRHQCREHLDTVHGPVTMSDGSSALYACTGTRLRVTVSNVCLPTCTLLECKSLMLCRIIRGSLLCGARRQSKITRSIGYQYLDKLAGTGAILLRRKCIAACLVPLLRYRRLLAGGLWYLCRTLTGVGLVEQDYDFDTSAPAIFSSRSYCGCYLLCRDYRCTS